MKTVTQSKYEQAVKSLGMAVQHLMYVRLFPHQEAAYDADMKALVDMIDRFKNRASSPTPENYDDDGDA